MGETEPNQEIPAQQSSDPTVLGEAQNLLVQGKRFMALGDYQSATDSLEQAVQLYDAYYGVAKIQCADAYLEYGNALVALANLEAGSGTDKIMKKAGIEEGDEEDEGEDGEEEDEEEGDDDEIASGEEVEDQKDTPVENGTAKENGNSAATTNGQSSANDEVKMETSPEKSKNGVERAENKNLEQQSSTIQQQPSASSLSPSAQQAPEPTPGTSSGQTSGDTNETNEEDEEATTIEIAWEVLCLAKRLFMTDESLEGRLKLAETLQKLGEISIEWDNNDNAVSILEECLNIRKAILPAEDRLIALTYYHLGLAHSFKSDTQNANENFQNAINVIEKRIEILKVDLDKAKSHQDTMAVSAYEKEINELKELLPDMTMRMDDSKEDGSQTSEVLKRTREELQQEDEEAKKVCLDKSKPVADITHLVKRKLEPKE